MQISSVNDVKIYNLSHGKSLPEWLSDRKKRQLQKKDAGTYKPRIRCYDTYQLSLKFERCLDSDVVAFDVLSDDYSKLVFLHCDRYVEFHSQHGHYYKTRIPKFGRDFSYHYPSCDLYFVGTRENNVCDINPVHHLFATGTSEGRVECWDPRVRNRVGLLDCALSSLTEGTEVQALPSVSALKFNGSLTMAVGTSTGQVLMYDLRSSQPLLVKDHFYNLPIKSLNFHDQLGLVISADSKIIKIWNKDNGKVFSSIQPQSNINDVCIYPQSGMLFTANEDPKMNTFYIPESPESTVYDDYKFVTRKDLENLGLSHLVGSSLLRAYMHGYFMDIRLYHKVRVVCLITFSTSS
ncbi:hypothetical protein INR49_014784 [Caranx melampygus]|nr:hypothetical protein INR49_014784 [Caranx melampygus]